MEAAVNPRNQPSPPNRGGADVARVTSSHTPKVRETPARSGASPQMFDLQPLPISVTTPALSGRSHRGPMRPTVSPLCARQSGASGAGTPPTAHHSPQQPRRPPSPACFTAEQFRNVRRSSAGRSPSAFTQSHPAPGPTDASIQPALRSILAHRRNLAPPGVPGRVLRSSFGCPEAGSEKRNRPFGRFRARTGGCAKCCGRLPRVNPAESLRPW